MYIIFQIFGDSKFVFLCTICVYKTVYNFVKQIIYKALSSSVKFVLNLLTNLKSKDNMVWVYQIYLLQLMSSIQFDLYEQFSVLLAFERELYKIVLLFHLCCILKNVSLERLFKNIEQRADSV